MRWVGGERKGTSVITSTIQILKNESKNTSHVIFNTLAQYRLIPKGWVTNCFE